MVRDDVTLDLAAIMALAPSENAGVMAATFERCDYEGMIVARLLSGDSVRCMFLQLEASVSLDLAVGDELLVMMAPRLASPIVLGRIGRYTPPQPQAHVTFEATESLTLKCGEASVELRADGRAMVKGEDVLLRAKGTQRIRAGNVAIN